MPIQYKHGMGEVQALATQAGRNEALRAQQQMQFQRDSQILDYQMQMAARQQSMAWELEKAATTSKLDFQREELERQAELAKEYRDRTFETNMARTAHERAIGMEIHKATLRSQNDFALEEKRRNQRKEKYEAAIAYLDELEAKKKYPPEWIQERKLQALLAYADLHEAAWAVGRKDKTSVDAYIASEDEKGRLEKAAKKKGISPEKAAGMSIVGPATTPPDPNKINPEDLPKLTSAQLKQLYGMGG